VSTNAILATGKKAEPLKKAAAPPGATPGLWREGKCSSLPMNNLLGMTRGGRRFHEK
jgi:hypothetical protein